MDESIDFDFYDDPPTSKASAQTSNVDAVKVSNANHRNMKQQKSYSSSSSDDESSSTHPSDLHGVQSGNEQKSESFVSSSSARYSHSSTSSSDQKSDSDSSLSSHKSSENELYSESKLLGHKSSYSNSTRTLTSSETDDEFKEYEYTLEDTKSTKRTQKGLRIPSKGRKQSSDSMTDVSPLTSPDKSPNVYHCGKPNSGEIPDKLNSVPVRHITKLNVVFKSDIDKEGNTDKKKISNHEHIDYHSIEWSSSDSDDDINRYTNGQEYPRARAAGKRAETWSLREDSATYQHRQRLLDSAARGSMDISNLLETVLEFEKQNYQRKAQQRESPINYHIGEKLLHDHHGRQRKNMSFTNEKVREIDRENQRLLKQIRNQSRPSSASSVRSSMSTRSKASNCSRMSSASTRSGTSRRRDDKAPKLYHSAANRLQYQRRIERENMQLLKRLQSAKPTPGLQRQRQLKQYKQQSEYMGTSINRNGISLQRANELTRNAEVVQKAMGLTKQSKPVKPAWQDRW